MRRALPATLLVALALAGCGDSAEEKAQASVCNARDDIQKQVDDLKALTPATFTTDAVSQSLQAIESDLDDMKNAQSDLSGDRRQQVESANQAFASQVQDVVKDIGTSLSASDAKTQLTQALQQLAAGYEQAFSRIDCN
jgi:uncharacterized protein YjbJ (UPF0337 family)